MGEEPRAVSGRAGPEVAPGLRGRCQRSPQRVSRMSTAPKGGGDHFIAPDTAVAWCMQCDDDELQCFVT